METDEPFASHSKRPNNGLFRVFLSALFSGLFLLRDDPSNETRFVWLARTDADTAQSPGPWKTSLVFWGVGAQEPGWLVRCLSEFAFRGVNLTKIESRPMRAQLGHYRFFVDCEGDARAGRSELHRLVNRGVRGGLRRHPAPARWSSRIGAGRSAGQRH